MLKNEAMHDVRSVTGSNYRNIMLLLGKSSVDSVKYEDTAQLKYHLLDNEDLWKVNTIKEIIDIKSGVLDLPGFQMDEVEAIMNNLCTY